MHDLIPLIVALLVATLRSSTPLIIAGLGELVSERAGVLNLGLEGMMLMGAVVGFMGTVASGSPVLGILAAMLAGMGMALIFGVLTLSLMANQVATGLALTIFGIGLSSLLGVRYEGTPIQGLATWMTPDLAEAPPLLQQFLLLDPLVYVSLLLPVAVWRFLYRSRAGLVLRAIGESPEAAHAIGYKVIRIRYLSTMFGGAMSGLGGAYLSLAYTPMWTQNMVAGRGWIVLALVVFSTWKPGWLVLGSWLFGFVTIAQFHAEGMGIDVSPDLLATLPYLSTIIVLVVISRDAVRLKLSAPASLGKAFHATT